MASTGKKSVRTQGQDPWATDAALAALHRSLVLLRAVSDQTSALALAGHLPAPVQTMGTEAVLAGVAARLEPGDWVLPGRRQAAIALLRGAQLSAWFGQALGRVADPSRGRQSPGHFAQATLRVTSCSGAPGSQLTHAVGLGRALRQQKQRAAAVALCGHVATSSADFPVALGFAALWRAPVVFVVAVGEGLARQTASGSVGIKAKAHGLPAIEVDGGDALEVARAAEDALERARDGAGPTLLCATCPAPPLQGPAPPAAGPRLVGPDEAAALWLAADPLARFETLLAQGGVLADSAAATVRAETITHVRDAAAAALLQPSVPVATLFDDVLRTRTPALTRQRRDALATRD